MKKSLKVEFILDLDHEELRDEYKTLSNLDIADMFKFESEDTDCGIEVVSVQCSDVE